MLTSHRENTKEQSYVKLLSNSTHFIAENGNEIAVYVFLSNFSRPQCVKNIVRFSDDVPEWERELQAELQEYEVVNDGSAMADEDLEKEILQQIEAEANQ